MTKNQPSPKPESQLDTRTTKKQQPSSDQPQPSNTRRRSHRRKQLIRRASSISAFLESIPSNVPLSTPQEPSNYNLWWIPWLTLLGGYYYQRECKRQDELTGPPSVYFQDTEFNKRLVSRLTMLQQDMKPSLIFGTSSTMNSIAAYLKLGHAQHRIREIMTMTSDGATVALDWELPRDMYTLHANDIKDKGEEEVENVLKGPIRRTVVIILHGINNDSSYGYIRSAMKACTEKGWIAVGLNFRGCGGIDLSTPRGYTAAYTGDIRCVVRKISTRLTPPNSLFLVGNSLGANLITKYLGEEGLAQTLPPCVAGAVSLGNPLRIHSANVSFPWAHILGLGLRKSFFLQRKSFGKMHCLHFQKAFRKALRASTVGEIDCTVAPFFIRNDPHPPFPTHVGYQDGQAYWKDASSGTYVPHVSVPLLKMSAQDDFLVHHGAVERLSSCLASPNVVVAKTRSGGHLGWNDGESLGAVMFRSSWADRAMVEFIEVVQELKGDGLAGGQVGGNVSKSADVAQDLGRTRVGDETAMVEQARQSAAALRSKL